MIHTKLIFLLLLPLGLSAQPAPEMALNGVINGKVADKQTGQPIEYANVAVYSARDSSLATGSVTAADGSFSLKLNRPGKYYTVTKFIGYLDTKSSPFTLTPKQLTIDLGEIKLDPSVKNLKELSVVGEQRSISYKIDKKVVSPGQFTIAAGGTAVDVLQNTPSITVDAEGSVSLRGSSNFMVLVDGRPTPFDPSDALQQIPVGSIENIEIITNPSAKYDPDGASGIINVITKKNRAAGINGVVNINANNQDTYGGDFVINYVNGNKSFFIGGNRSTRMRWFDYTSDSWNYSNGVDTIRNYSSGDRKMSFTNTSLKVGGEWRITDKNTFGLQFEGGGMGKVIKADLNYENSRNQEAPVFSSSNANASGDNVFGSGTFTFDHKFDTKGQILQTMLFYMGTNGKDNTYSYEYGSAKSFLQGTLAKGDNSGNEIRAKADYVKPFENDGRLEAGVQMRVTNTTSWNDQTNGLTMAAINSHVFGESSPQYQSTDFYQSLPSFYATYSAEIGKIGYQLGLRGEQTIRKTTFSAFGKNDSSFNINTMDWFPTLHLSYKMPADQQLFAGYSRRIERPRDYYLNPFEVRRDAYAIMKGDPNLLPELTDQFELGYQLAKNSNFISIEMFHRHTKQIIDRVKTPYSGDPSGKTYLMWVANIGEDYRSGAEAMVNYDLTKWWTLNLSASVYDYRLLEKFNGVSVDRKSNNWNGRMSNTWKLGMDTRFQYDMMYESATADAQGTESAMMFASAAIKQNLFNRKLSATLSVMDLFNTAGKKSTISGPTFYSKTNMDMVGPVITLTLSYKINNFTPQRRSDDKQGGGMEFDAGM